jgi:thiamine monophosphate kinase
VERFFKPEPFFDAGKVLSREIGVTSLIDISDSLLESIELLLPSRHARGSGHPGRKPGFKKRVDGLDSRFHGNDGLPVTLGAQVNLDLIPISKQLATLKISPKELVSGGEDYALLCTLTPQAFKRIRNKIPITVIGQIEGNRTSLDYFHAGRRLPRTSYFHHY